MKTYELEPGCAVFVDGKKGKFIEIYGVTAKFELEGKVVNLSPHLSFVEENGIFIATTVPDAA